MSSQQRSSRPFGGRSGTPSRRWLLRAGILAGASLLSAACAGQTPAPATTAPPTPAPAATAAPTPATAATAAPTAQSKPAAAAGKATYWNYMVDRQEQENKAIAAFRDAHPKIQVVEEYIPWDQYWQKLNATLASSGAPDVWNTAPTFYYEYIKRNQLLDLRDRIKGDLKASDFYTETLPLWEFPRGSGKTYGIPRDFGVGLLFFNKDLLDKAGVAAPTNDWTYEDMLKAALKVNHPSDDPKQAVFGTLASGGRVFLDALIHGNGGEVLDETQTKSLYDQPVAVESIRWMVDLVRSHKVAPLPQFFEGLGSPFGTGRVAMVIDGTWAVQGNRKVTAFKFDAVLQPKGKVKRATIGEPDGFVISQQTKDPDSAWELAKFMVLSPAMEAWYLIDPGMIPVTKPMGESPNYRAVKPPDPALYFESYKYLFADYTAGFNEWQTAKDQIMGKAFLGEIPPDEAAKQITKAVNDILDKNK